MSSLNTPFENQNADMRNKAAQITAMAAPTISSQYWSVR